mmetsp:Transcript_10613/g.31391  ORF Transcript_10613/g.31391 Transcript_10613/m.31391 type:complete len:537 (+) Transcript_10613:244-1854(+)
MEDLLRGERLEVLHLHFAGLGLLFEEPALGVRRGGRLAHRHQRVRVPIHHVADVDPRQFSDGRLAVPVGTDHVRDALLQQLLRDRPRPGAHLRWQHLIQEDLENRQALPCRVVLRDELGELVPAAQQPPEIRAEERSLGAAGRHVARLALLLHEVGGELEDVRALVRLGHADAAVLLDAPELLAVAVQLELVGELLRLAPQRSGQHRHSQIRLDLGRLLDLDVHLLRRRLPGEEPGRGDAGLRVLQLIDEAVHPLLRPDLTVAAAARLRLRRVHAEPEDVLHSQMLVLLECGELCDHHAVAGSLDRLLQGDADEGRPSPLQGDPQARAEELRRRIDLLYPLRRVDVELLDVVHEDLRLELLVGLAGRGVRGHLADPQAVVLLQRDHVHVAEILLDLVQLRVLDVGQRLVVLPKPEVRVEEPADRLDSAVHDQEVPLEEAGAEGPKEAALLEAGCAHFEVGLAVRALDPRLDAEGDLLEAEEALRCAYDIKRLGRGLPRHPHGRAIGAPHAGGPGGGSRKTLPPPHPVGRKARPTVR